MKEIKFRCWFENEMYYWDMLKTDSPCLDYLKNAEIMQFTGLRDKNGKEIYEGDIVRSAYDTRHLRGYNPEKRIDIMVVEHDNCNPCFVLVSPHNRHKREYDFIVCGLRTNEVIGNIYENPELLHRAEAEDAV